MIQTETIWADSGFDCDHCGGEVSKRTDRESGMPDRTCYQCKQCGCQWSRAGEVLRVGVGASCKAAQEKREGKPISALLRTGLWQFVIGLVLILVIMRFGGFALIRLLFPLLLLGLAIFLIIRYGQEQEWW